MAGFVAYYGDVDLCSEIDHLRNAFKTLRPIPITPNVNVVAKQANIIKLLQDFREMVTDLEQKFTIRIFGIPEKRNEDIMGIVLDFFMNVLFVIIEPLDIYTLFRSGKKRRRQSRSIVVKFSNKEAYNQVRSREDYCVGVKCRIAEELCAERVKVWEKARRNFGERNVSVYDGTIRVLIDNGYKQFKSIGKLDDFLASYRKGAVKK